MTTVLLKILEHILNAIHNEIFMSTQTRLQKGFTEGCSSFTCYCCRWCCPAFLIQAWNASNGLEDIISCKPYIYVPWSTSEISVRLPQWNRFKPSSKIFYWPFQGGTSFVDLLCYLFLSCVCYAFVRVCLYVPCGHLLGKGWPLSFRLWCLTVSLSLSHWYPGSGVVLDCIDSWSLHPYLRCR